MGVRLQLQNTTSIIEQKMKAVSQLSGTQQLRPVSILLPARGRRCRCPECKCTEKYRPNDDDGRAKRNWSKKCVYIYSIVGWVVVCENEQDDDIFCSKIVTF